MQYLGLRYGDGHAEDLAQKHQGWFMRFIFFTFVPNTRVLPDYLSDIENLVLPAGLALLWVVAGETVISAIVHLPTNIMLTCR